MGLIPTPFSPPSGPAAGSFNGPHPIHISKSAIAALTLPLAPSAIWRVMAMGAPQRRARKPREARLARPPCADLLNPPDRSSPLGISS